MVTRETEEDSKPSEAEVQPSADPVDAASSVGSEAAAVEVLGLVAGLDAWLESGLSVSSGSKRRIGLGGLVGSLASGIRLDKHVMRCEIQSLTNWSMLLLPSYGYVIPVLSVVGLMEEWMSTACVGLSEGACARGNISVVNSKPELSRMSGRVGSTETFISGSARYSPFPLVLSGGGLAPETSSPLPEKESSGRVGDLWVYISTRLWEAGGFIGLRTTGDKKLHLFHRHCSPSLGSSFTVDGGVTRGT